YKNVASQKIAVFAWDSANSVPKTGDASNITAQISIDGGTCAATNDTNPTELDATDAPGIYLFDLTQAETNGDLIILSAKSSTSDIDIRPVSAYTKLEVIDGNYTVQDVMKILLAYLGGKTSGGGTETIIFRNPADTKDRVTQSVDSCGNRSGVTLDVS
ncbi:MAG: hypothetical protein GWN00_09165, partial [Aliifodinibius sp.]|nr:hypothetical protein [Fodinibius sp.]NIY24965.1 hypothetical protein [Fodinibius sp.]